MRRPLSSSVFLLAAMLVLGIPAMSQATQCFYGDFDNDDNPWTIRTACTGDVCGLNFILEAGEVSPAGQDFTIYVSEGCCQVNFDGFYGARVEMNMSTDLVEWSTATYTTCTCCSDWFIDGHFRSDAVFVPGERYVIGTGTAEPLCDDTWWQCVPPHTFHAEYFVNHFPPCEENTIDMSVQCSGADAPDESAIAAARLSMPSPNPVTDDLRFTVSLPEAGPVRVRIFDASGAIVASLVDEDLAAGSHPQAWRPVDARGSRLASGIYFLRLDANGVRASRPFVIAR